MIKNRIYSVVIVLFTAHLFMPSAFAVDSTADLVKDASVWRDTILADMQEQGERHHEELEKKKTSLEAEIELKLTALRDASDERYKKAIESQIAMKKNEIDRINHEIDDMRENGKTLLNTTNSIVNQGTTALLEMQKDQALRKTTLASIAIGKQIEQNGSTERLKFWLDEGTLTKVSTYAVLTSCGVCVGYYGVGFIFKCIEQWIADIPTLVRATSLKGPFDTFNAYMKQVIFGYKPKPVVFDDIILAPDVDATLKTLAQTTQVARLKGMPYRNLLLYGPPGVGKTMFARRLAQFSGMDYAIISGADFSQFTEGKAVYELHKLLDWAQGSPRGVILFIDEADACFRKRSLLSESGIKLINAFLSRTGTLSQKCMLVLATNIPDILDTAVLSRIATKINVPLPGPVERATLLKMYAERNLLSGESGIKVDIALNQAFLENVAQRLEGFSGRDIEQLTIDCQAEAMVTPGSGLTVILFNKILERKISEKKEFALAAG